MEDSEKNIEQIWIPLPPPDQDLADREQLEIDVPVVVVLAGGLAILALQLVFPLLVSLVRIGFTASNLERLSLPLHSPFSRRSLKNDDNCGITTGGQVCVRFVNNILIIFFQDECWWDCTIIADPLLAGTAIANPECLVDCFSSFVNGDPDCLAFLIEDVTTKGTCTEATGNPAAELNIWGASTLDDQCTYEEDFDDDYGSTFTITEGTCSAQTETLLQTDECQNSLAEQILLIRNTIELLIQFSCRNTLFNSLPFSSARRAKQGEETESNTTGPAPVSFMNTTAKMKTNLNYTNTRQRTTRLAPVNEIDLATGTKTELNFTNTLHRYPWICSLRTKGITAEHLCAVTLLSIDPVIIIGPAHCTYLCNRVSQKKQKSEFCFATNPSVFIG